MHLVTTGYTIQDGEWTVDATPALFGPRAAIASTPIVCAEQGQDPNHKVVLVQRGENSFCALAKSAQDRGAVAVVVYDNRSSAMVMSAGEGTESHGIFIPVMMVQSTDGKALLTQGHLTSGDRGDDRAWYVVSQAEAILRTRAACVPRLVVGTVVLRAWPECS